MPDISMCSGEGCELRRTCYRYNAKPNPFWQSYFKDPPVNPEGGCAYYWESTPVEEEASNGRV